MLLLIQKSFGSSKFIVIACFQVEYEDFIEFYTEDNLTRFKVNIRSVFCEPKLHVPSALKFGPVGVEDFNKKTFKIENHR